MDRVRSQSTTFDKATLNPPLVLFKPTKLSKVFIVERGGKNSYLKRVPPSQKLDTLHTGDVIREIFGHNCWLRS